MSILLIHKIPQATWSVSVKRLLGKSAKIAWAKTPIVNISSAAHTNVGRSHNGGIFVASAGLLPDRLFVFPLYWRREAGISAISDAAQSALTKGGCHNSFPTHAGCLGTILLWNSIFIRRPDMSMQKKKKKRERAPQSVFTIFLLSRCVCLYTVKAKLRGKWE